MGWQVLSPFRGYANHQFTGGYDFRKFFVRFYLTIINDKNLSLRQFPKNKSKKKSKDTNKKHIERTNFGCYNKTGTGNYSGLFQKGEVG